MISSFMPFLTHPCFVCLQVQSLSRYIGEDPAGLPTGSLPDCQEHCHIKEQCLMTNQTAMCITPHHSQYWYNSSNILCIIFFICWWFITYRIFHKVVSLPSVDGWHNNLPLRVIINSTARVLWPQVHWEVSLWAWPVMWVSCWQSVVFPIHLQLLGHTPPRHLISQCNFNRKPERERSWCLALVWLVSESFV